MTTVVDTLLDQTEALAEALRDLHGELDHALRRHGWAEAERWTWDTRITRMRETVDAVMAGLAAVAVRLDERP
jgi:hypothetical protein